MSQSIHRKKETTSRKREVQGENSPLSQDAHLFSERLRELVPLGTASKVAREAGLTSSTLDGYLRGGIPSADRALALADVLGVSVRWLITGEEDPARLGNEWLGLREFPLHALRAGKPKPEETSIVPVHPQWLTRTAAGVPMLWITHMPASTLEGVPNEGDMIVCCDAAEPHGEGLYLYRYHDVPVVRRFIAQGATAPGVMDVTMFGVPGMELLGRVLGAIKMQPAG